MKNHYVIIFYQKLKNNEKKLYNLLLNMLPLKKENKKKLQNF